jgi:hypothetical protein
MKVLLGCEFSGVVREAFRKKGHDAWSCDILPAEDDSKYHIQDDIRKVLHEDWDLGIFFPPCTHICVSGAKWFKQKKWQQESALDFVARLMVAPIGKIAIENPIGVISSKIRKPDVIVQPWQFRHGETKATCLWLKNLPKLKPTNVVEGREQRIHKIPPGENRGRERSRTYHGIAEAMAEQWGNSSITDELDGD